MAVGDEQALQRRLVARREGALQPGQPAVGQRRQAFDFDQHPERIAVRNGP